MSLFEILCRRREFRLNLDEQRQCMYRVAYSWCQDASLADDLVQEALTKSYKNLHQLRELKAMKKWMFDIMTNCWRDHLRRRKPVEDLDALPDNDVPCHSDSHEQDEISKIVRRTVWKLPEKYKEVLALVDLAGFSYAEVADILELPIGTVTSRLARGRNMLRMKLKKFYTATDDSNVIHIHQVAQKLNMQRK